MTMLPKEGKNFWEKIFGAAEVGRLGFSRQTFIGGEMENLLMEEERRERRGREIQSVVSKSKSGTKNPLKILF